MCAFVYSESACPPSLESVLAAEIDARRREELNGLYVAMSRAREQLIFSATEPARSAGVSWWQRIEPRATAWTPEAGRQTATASTAAAVLMTAVALERPAPRSAVPSAASAHTRATRLGQAVHRFLEWAAAKPSGVALDELAAGSAAEFAVSAPEVLRVGRAILGSAECSRFFGGPSLRWAGNEVPVSEAGEPLRIDRLVQLDEGSGPTWWVLDYKLQQAPDALTAYHAQLRRYRRAVQQAQPGVPVRCAFITGAGTVVEVD